ncbi:DUF6062 family protein [Breznakiella homolactica]|uniref:Uncharacterized protein n=1 Tax=Breznakiella homolactica TaxID=2798577 RepID=A0A7T8BA28_9SPIR|nr:DUF6062 family protein [Breznakiella homolactica]QQO08931.1 DUF6062 family protein [Breznakiella homolactica]
MAVDRHINFFELQKASEKPGCPLCRIISDRADRYIDNMLFEHVSDRGFRALYRAAGGFCDVHSRNLESFRDGLAVAILGRDILEDRIEAFKKNKPWKPKGKCPVCAERDRIEQEYLSFLAQSDGDSQDERDLRAAFTASDGLCAPHYGKMQELCRKIPGWLREFQEGKFEELLRKTETFIDLSAYGRQGEFSRLPENDKVIWKELARTLRGRADGGH